MGRGRASDLRHLPGWCAKDFDHSEGVQPRWAHSLSAQLDFRYRRGEHPCGAHAVHHPSAGYYVELWLNAAVGRGVYGGSEWNGLSVSKISTEEN
ncbi:hypothetical protein QV65_32490 [Rhodococcus erythropolis]|nr:hypothetical protein QV65_32490 [Rhodococcus erythropolis]